jgi:predicted RNA-binding Zn-ribbon protein involved in translation (DUF1610 family)
MKLHEMKTKCRMCGRELIADDKDDDFVSFYCMRCGVYTTRPVEEFKDQPAPAPVESAAAAIAKPEETKG